MTDLIALHSKLSALFPNQRIVLNAAVGNWVGGAIGEHWSVSICAKGDATDSFECIANERSLPEFWQAVARYHSAHPQECAVDVLAVAVAVSKQPSTEEAVEHFTT